jgi:hypothetical protein
VEDARGIALAFKHALALELGGAREDIEGQLLAGRSIAELRIEDQDGRTISSDAAASQYSQ